MNTFPFSHVDTSPRRGTEPLRPAQTSPTLGDASRLVSSSQGLAWPGLYCAVTEELPHEAVHRAVPALWLVTTDTPLQIHRDVLVLLSQPITKETTEISRGESPGRAGGR